MIQKDKEALFIGFLAVINTQIGLTETGLWRAGMFFTVLISIIYLAIWSCRK